MLIWLLLTLKPLLSKDFSRKCVLVSQKLPQTIIWQDSPRELGLDSIV
ncbi:MAG: hypothetical protein ACK56Y_12515 [Pseudanabaena sp.]